MLFVYLSAKWLKIAGSRAHIVIISNSTSRLYALCVSAYVRTNVGFYMLHNEVFFRTSRPICCLQLELRELWVDFIVYYIMCIYTCIHLHVNWMLKI